MSGERELMRLHIEAEFTHDSAGRMLRVNEPNGSPAPRFFLGRTAEGNVWRVRNDVDDELARDLESVCTNEPTGGDLRAASQNAASYEALLARAAPIQKTWTGPAYHFPKELPASSHTMLVTETNCDVLRPHLEAWLPDVLIHQPLVAVVISDHAVSVCCSVRITPAADEAGVETVPEFRGRGYAGQVVAAWARAVRDMGRIPLYSTAWQNVASQGVARTLGLIQFGADLHIT